MLALYVVFGVAMVVFLELPLNGLVNTLRRITFLSAVYAMLVLALNLHWGYTGLFNIGVAGFMAIGVYTMAIISGPELGLGLPLPLGIVGGVLASALVGLIAALPALRLDADYLAIVTVAFSEIIRLTLNSSVFAEMTLFGTTVGTGGGQGIRTPENPIRAIFYTDPGDTSAGLTPVGDVLFEVTGSLKVFLVSGVGIRDSVVIGLAYVIALVAIVAAFYWLLRRIGNSPFGRVLKAIREDEMVANSLGKDTQLFKIKTFMVGCALMGLAGILWRGSTGFTIPSDYMPIQTFYIFLALIIGGAGSNTGSVLGGIVFATLLFEGPPQLARIIPVLLDDLFGLQITDAPNTSIEAIAPLSSLDVTPFIAYSLENISTLRFIFLGVLIVYLMQNRPEGLLGHRKESAAAVDLSAGRNGGGDRE
ncbi:branched-chain amino acid ABC transporter permease [Halorientalis salina]|uniref:branched-chain amino acid ABC transporter permease n=1 Tax=Halorientalis salina TaxID=2932266 RepID=UPI002022A066|nr:branched-chain amino acid ABC transporter permease [Halorientalis salina]